MKVRNSFLTLPVSAIMIQEKNMNNPKASYQREAGRSFYNIVY